MTVEPLADAYSLAPAPVASARPVPVPQQLQDQLLAQGLSRHSRATVGFLFELTRLGVLHISGDLLEAIEVAATASGGYLSERRNVAELPSERKPQSLLDLETLARMSPGDYSLEQVKIEAASALQVLTFLIRERATVAKELGAARSAARDRTTQLRALIPTLVALTGAGVFAALTGSVDMGPAIGAALTAASAALGLNLGEWVKMHGIQTPAEIAVGDATDSCEQSNALLPSLRTLDRAASDSTGRVLALPVVRARRTARASRTPLL